MFALVEDLLSSDLSRGLGKRGSWGMRIQIRKEPARDVLSKETHWHGAHDATYERDGVACRKVTATCSKKSHAFFSQKFSHLRRK